MRRVLAFLFLTIVVSPGISQAQELIETPFEWVEGSLRVGVFAGNVSTSNGSLDLGINSSTVFGARLRTRVSSPLSLEIGFGLGSSERSVIDPRLPTGPAPVDTVDTNWFIIEGGFQIALTGARTIYGFQPYVVLTGGILAGRDEVVSDSMLAAEDVRFRYNLGTQALFSAGLGVEWLSGGPIGIGVEVRDHLWKVNAPDGFYDLDVLELLEELGLDGPASEWTHNIELSASIYYYF